MARYIFNEWPERIYRQPRCMGRIKEGGALLLNRGCGNTGDFSDKGDKGDAAANRENEAITRNMCTQHAKQEQLGMWM